VGGGRGTAGITLPHVMKRKKGASYDIVERLWSVYLLGK
jgi:hypothetical protein